MRALHMSTCRLLAMGKTRKSFYAVRVGRNTGVYSTWEECQAQVNGFSGAVFKGFSTRDEADQFVSQGKRSAAARSSYSGGFARKTSQPRSRPSKSEPPSWRDPTRGALSEHRPVVYSDGCCFGNGRGEATGGVGVYWGDDHPQNVCEKLEGHQTNQRAELVSACRALETAMLQGHTKVELRTDSSYTIKAMTEWVSAWKRNEWMTARSTPVKNKEDIERLDRLCQQVDVKWTHVPGHAGIHGNEAADSLAKAGAQK